jgi:hypothetical protein
VVEPEGIWELGNTRGTGLIGGGGQPSGSLTPRDHLPLGSLTLEGIWELGNTPRSPRDSLVVEGNPRDHLRLRITYGDLPLGITYPRDHLPLGITPLNEVKAILIT